MLYADTHEQEKNKKIQNKRQACFQVVREQRFLQYLDVHLQQQQPGLGSQHHNTKGHWFFHGAAC